MGGNLCSPRNMKARLKFDRENVNKDQDFWNNVLWTVESTTELFGHQNRGQVCHKPNTAVQENNFTAWRWRCRGLRMLCCSSTCSAHHHRIHHEFYRESEGARRTGETITATRQQAKTHQSIHQELTENFKMESWKGRVEAQMMWVDLKRAVHARTSSNISQLEEFCIEDLDKLSLNR